MNKRALSNLLWICLVIYCFFSSCAAESTAEPERRGEEKGILHVPMTRGTYAEESDIQSARMIVFRGNGDLVKNTNTPSDPMPYTPYTFVDTVPVGYLNVYLIANEMAGWNLSAVTTEAQLMQKIYDYGAPTQLPDADATHHVPMFGMYKGIYINALGNSTKDLTSPNPGVDPYPITVERIFSKVTLKLQCLFGEQANGGDPVELKSISLKRVPKESYLVPKRFIGGISDFNDYHTTSPYLAPTSGYVENATGFQDSISFYIPEYMANDTSLYTYLSIKANVKGFSTIDREFKLVLGEGLTHGNKFMLGDSILPDGHQRNVGDVSVLRNTHYVIDARIVNFDKSGYMDIDLKLDVIAWDGTIADPDDVHDYALFVSQSEFHPTSSPYKGVVNIVTDYGKGWNASVESATGGATCTLQPLVTGQPSGALNFTYTGGSPSSIKIKITTGPDNKITKYIMISR
jgi:hypothetical protein